MPQTPTGLRRHVRHLRANQTDAELALWKSIRARRFAGHKFRRQVPVGPYVVDFYCHQKRLVIELDGGQHNFAEVSAYDSERSAYLAKRGLMVLRFWNNEIFQRRDDVLTRIWGVLQGSDMPSPDFAKAKSPSPEGRG